MEDGFGDSDQHVEIYKSRVNESQPDLQNSPLAFHMHFDFLTQVLLDNGTHNKMDFSGQNKL